MNEISALNLLDEKLQILNQTKLPLVEEYILTDDLERICESIEKLEVRGAPAIGIAAAYGFALSFKLKSELNDNFIMQVYSRLAKTRPTAKNLFFAIDRMLKVAKKSNQSNIYHNLIEEAIKIHKEDIEMCNKMGENGIEIFKKKSIVLTHCNTGSLATGGSGTALSVIKTAFYNNLIEMVFVDETRPLLQGSRLTAFELEKVGIPFKIIVDSAASHTILTQNVDLVITGADRIASNGDSANKIGTYNLAISCNYHKIPFYIAAPSSTIDSQIKNGKGIIIEERSNSEITSLNGNEITKSKYNTFSPAFDVTPNSLISGIVTEKQVFRFPYKFV